MSNHEAGESLADGEHHLLGAVLLYGSLCLFREVTRRDEDATANSSGDDDLLRGCSLCTHLLALTGHQLKRGRSLMVNRRWPIRYPGAELVVAERVRPRCWEGTWQLRASWSGEC